MTAVMEQLGFPSRDGTLLHLRTWTPDEPRPGAPVLCFVHGYADHGGRYRLPAEHFTGKGHTCFAVDYRGHGKAGGRRGHIESFRQYVDDVEAFLSEARTRAPGDAPMVLVAHSQGGLIACHYLAEGRSPQPAAAVIASPAVGLAMKLPVWKVLAARGLARAMPTFAMPTGIDIGDLSRDADVVAETRGDPLYGRNATAGWYQEFLAAQARAFDLVSDITVPTLVVQAGGDRVASRQATERLVSRFREGVATYKEYPGYFHELLNDRGREQVYDDIAHWLDEALSGAGGEN